MIRFLSTTSFFTTKGKHIIVCMVAHKRDTKKRAVKGRLVGILKNLTWNNILTFSTHLNLEAVSKSGFLGFVGRLINVMVSVSPSICMFVEE